MAHDVWSELGESPELQEALEGLRVEQMPDSVAEQILSTFPPVGGGGGSPSTGGGLPGPLALSWAAAVAVVGVLAAGWIWHGSSAPTAVPSPHPGSGAAAGPPDSADPADEAGAEELPEQVTRRLRPDPETPSSGLAQRSEPATSVASPGRPRPPNPGDEIELLERTRASLPAHPHQAARLLRRHARQFPHSQFRQERDLLRVEAAVAAGRGDRARRLADAFLRRYPRSAQRARAEALRARAPRRTND